MNFIKSLPGYLWLLVFLCVLITVHYFMPSDATIVDLIKTFAGATLAILYKETGVTPLTIKGKALKPIVKQSPVVAK